MSLSTNYINIIYIHVWLLHPYELIKNNRLMIYCPPSVASSLTAHTSHRYQPHSLAHITPASLQWVQWCTPRPIRHTEWGWLHCQCIPHRHTELDHFPLHTPQEQLQLCRNPVDDRPLWLLAGPRLYHTQSSRLHDETPLHTLHVDQTFLPVEHLHQLDWRLESQQCKITPLLTWTLTVRLNGKYNTWHNSVNGRLDQLPCKCP